MYFKVWFRAVLIFHGCWCPKIHKRSKISYNTDTPDQKASKDNRKAELQKGKSSSCESRQELSKITQEICSESGLQINFQG